MPLPPRSILEVFLRLSVRRPHVVIAAACALAFLAYLHRVGFGSAGPRIKEALELSDSDYGWVMTSFLLAYGLFEIPWGILCDRCGPRGVLWLTVMGSSILTAATTLVSFEAARLLAVLIALRTLFGTFQAGIFPALARVIADTVPASRRATAKGFIWTASRVGGAVSPLLVTALMTRVDWPWTLTILSAVGLVWIVFCLPAFPRREVAPDSTSAPQREPVPWKAIYCSGNVWALCVLYGCGGFTASFYITTLSDYLRNHRGFPEQTVAWMASLPLACGVVACLAGGMFSDYLVRRTGQRKWCRRLQGASGYLLAGGAALATIWVEAPLPLALLLALSFVGFDLTMAPAWASCVDIGERWAGTLGGAMNMMGNFLSAGGTFLAGQLLGRTFGNWEGKHLLFVCFAASYVVGALLWLRVDVTQPVGKSQ